MYRTAQQRQWDEQNILDYAKKEARESGLKEGALKIARNLKVEGIDIKIIANATGLSMEDVIAL